MLCAKCNFNTATKKTCMLTAGFQQEMYLCDECYDRLYSKAAGLENKFYNNIFNTALGGLNIKTDKICSNCKTRLSEFEKTALSGCELCYDAFAAEIESFIKKQQGKTVHIGKSPKSYKTYLELSQERQNLVKEYDNAVAASRLADVQRLKKEIEALTRHLKTLSKDGEG